MTSKAKRFWVLPLAMLASSSALAQGPVGATTEVYASFKARLTKADPAAKGDLTLFVSAEADNGERAVIRVPLASTGEAYGEERTCRKDAGGREVLTYTAGLEERNYMRFEAAAEYKDFRFLLNKYLCRLLASPFHCGEREVRLTTAWGSWRLGREMHVDLLSAASATVDTTPVRVEVTEVPFDHERCAVVAPSGGFCCVGGKTTEWHCGGSPAGSGWEQVSGECWHRETAVSCHDGEPLPELPRLWP